MKKLSLKLSTILPVLSMVMTILVLQSCRCVSGVTSNVESQEIQAIRTVDTVVLRDSVYIYERIKGDTVFLTRTEWRERWRTKIMHDTIRDVQYITQTIESPPVKYVPKFYKGCVWALGVIGLLAIGYGLLKWRS